MFIHLFLITHFPKVLGYFQFFVIPTIIIQVLGPFQNQVIEISTLSIFNFKKCIFLLNYRP